MYDQNRRNSIHNITLHTELVKHQKEQSRPPKHQCMITSINKVNMQQ